MYFHITIFVCHTRVITLSGFSFFLFTSFIWLLFFSFFFFQAEDGIRDDLVTGVQTCALPILIVVAAATAAGAASWLLVERVMLARATRLARRSRRIRERHMGGGQLTARTAP